MELGKETVLQYLGIVVPFLLGIGLVAFMELPMVQMAAALDMMVDLGSSLVGMVLSLRMDLCPLVPLKMALFP